MTKSTITLTALAKALGISKGQASKCASAGMPTDDVEAARRWRAANLHPSWAKDAGAPNAAGDGDGFYQAGRAKALAVKEQYLALTAKRDYEVSIGKLVDAEAVQRAQFEMARQLRDAVLAIPSRLQDTLAACADAVECGRMLEAEIRQALESAAEAARLLGDDFDAELEGANGDHGGLY